MTNNELKHLYFEWMYRLVCDDGFTVQGRSSHRMLLKILNSIPFFADHMNPNDDNRAIDGVDLRYRFAYEEKYDYRIVASVLDGTPCSMLEMMIALAIRCESLAYDPSEGDRTGFWFWGMLISLGLEHMNDYYIYNHGRAPVEEVIYRFLHCDYEPNGKGGLFTIPDANHDIRNDEIWKQMCYYLNTYF